MDVWLTWDWNVLQSIILAHSSTRVGVNSEPEHWYFTTEARSAQSCSATATAGCRGPAREGSTRADRRTLVSLYVLHPLLMYSTEGSIDKFLFRVCCTVCEMLVNSTCSVIEWSCVSQNTCVDFSGSKIFRTHKELFKLHRWLLHVATLCFFGHSNIQYPLMIHLHTPVWVFTTSPICCNGHCICLGMPWVASKCIVSSLLRLSVHTATVWLLRPL